MVGGYGTLLVFFAVASALTVNVRQRAAELELLRCSGATPGQIRRMVVGEAVAMALVGTAAAVLPALLGGRLLVALFQDTGQVAASVDHSFGAVALSSGSRRHPGRLGGRGTARAAAGHAGAAAHGATAVVARLGGAGGLRGGGVLHVRLLGDGRDADGVPGAGRDPAFGGVRPDGAALLNGVLGRLALGGASGWLAVRNLRRRAGELSGILMALILFTAVSTATLTMQAVESDEVAASGMVKSVDAKNLETLNYTVVGIIVVFVCVMLVNSLYAATTYRGREFGQQRLAGATPGQVLGVVGVEGLVLTVVGLLFGTLAALAGIVPFTVVRSDAVLPEQLAGVWAAVATVGAAATVGTSLFTARRVLRTPAVRAVGATA